MREKKVYKIAIIGAGMIADFHAKAIRDLSNARLIAVYGRNRTKAEELANRYECDAYDDIDELMSLGELDVVTIATPSGAHLEPAIKAAKSGKHILCEKPLEVSAPRILKMIKECSDNKVVLGGIFNRRFNPAVRLFKQAIENGRFGKIAIADAQIKWFRTQEYYDSGQWRGTWKLDGGGALMNQAIHTIDLLQYLMGDILSLSGNVSTIAHKGIEVEDTAVAMLKFKNGALGSIQASTACWSKNGHPAMINISGNRGSVFLSDDKFSVWEFDDEQKEDVVVHNKLMKRSEVGLGANDPNAINHEGHTLNISAFLEAIEHNKTPEIDGLEAMKSVRIIRAIYESAEKNGKWIML